jgi:N-acetyl-gamma-glutamylphosphate reductase
MEGMRVVIVGATGMVGGYALRYMLELPGVTSVTAIGRRKLDISHPIPHADSVNEESTRKTAGCDRAVPERISRQVGGIDGTAEAVPARSIKGESK